MTRFPRPLAPGDRIAVTSPSSGVGPDLQPRLEVALRSLRDRGYEVVVGECMSGDDVRSAPKEQRAAELVDFLTDPAVAAVVPPWGGELAIDLLDQLDWERWPRPSRPGWSAGATCLGSCCRSRSGSAGPPARLEPHRHAVRRAGRPAALARPAAATGEVDPEQPRAAPRRTGTTTRETPRDPTCRSTSHRLGGARRRRRGRLTGVLIGGCLEVRRAAGRHAVRRRAGVRPRARRRGAAGLPRGLRARRLRRLLGCSTGCGSPAGSSTRTAC